MTDAERIALLEVRWRRWYDRAHRLQQGAAALSPKWAEEILNGWEHDADIAEVRKERG